MKKKMMKGLLSVSLAALLAGSAGAAELETVTKVTPIYIFSDVNSWDWYYAAISHVQSNGIMNGVDADHFEPNSVFTRAMAVVTLYRMIGSPSTGNSQLSFTDLSESWYTDAIKWAVKNKVDSGITATSFEPDTPITREEMTRMIYRTAQLQSKTNGKVASLSSFSDAGSVSANCKSGVEWAVAVGLMTGDNGQLRPQGQATRAEIATLLMKFHKILNGESLL